MKGTTLLALVLLTGCAGYKPLVQLEAEALVSGDWSLVEQRERIIAKRNARSGATCPDGMISLCRTSFSNDECTCVKSRALNTIFDSR